MSFLIQHKNIRSNSMSGKRILHMLSFIYLNFIGTQNAAQASWYMHTYDRETGEILEFHRIRFKIWSFKRIVGPISIQSRTELESYESHTDIASLKFDRIEWCLNLYEELDTGIQ